MGDWEKGWKRFVCGRITLDLISLVFGSAGALKAAWVDEYLPGAIGCHLEDVVALCLVRGSDLGVTLVLRCVKQRWHVYLDAIVDDALI